jgi:hypothetical protein
MERALPLVFRLLSARNPEVSGKALRSDVVLIVSWVTADCDLHHIFQVKRNYSGCVSALQATRTITEKFLFINRHPMRGAPLASLALNHPWQSLASPNL